MSIATKDPIRENEETLRFEAYEDDFKTHFEDVYGDEADDFRRYAIAYRFGYDMARDFRFKGQSWLEAKPSLEEEWDEDNGLTWEDAAPAVQYSWVEVRDRLGMVETAEDADNEYEGPFRAHYQANYSDLENAFDYYKPAYQYGYAFGADVRQVENDKWEDVSAELRQRWEEEHDDEQSSWEEFKSAIKHGWEKAKEVVGGDAERNAIYNNHYVEHYEDSPMPYSAYTSAYRYGAALAIDERYSRHDWKGVEPTARKQWEETAFEGKWDDVREAVRFGWLQLRPTS